MKKFKLGSTVYIVSNGCFVKKAVVRNAYGNLYTLLIEDGTSTRLTALKIFDTKEDAKKSLTKYVASWNMLSEEQKYSNKRATQYDYYY